jgi:solute carrier family 35 protein F5
VPNEEVLSMQLLFGYIGVINTIMLGPIVLGMSAAGVLTLHGLTGVVAAWIIVGALFNNVLSDYLWARSIVLTSPTVATVGLSLTIPLAFLSDFLLGKGTAGYLSGFGAVFVVFGFVFVNTGIEPLLERFRNVAEYARLENVK